jgi:hypothetical protein
MSQVPTRLAVMAAAALVGALVVTGPAGSTNGPASRVSESWRGLVIVDAYSSPSGGGVRQELYISYRNRPNIRIRDEEGIQTSDPGCTQRSATVVTCRARDQIQVFAWAGRDFIKFRSRRSTASGSATAGAAGRPRTSVRVFGGAGVDTVFGGPGHQGVNGGSRDDKLRGQRGRDKLLGKEGDDLLNGGRGRDRCIGGKGDNRVRRCEVLHRPILPGP